MSTPAIHNFKATLSSGGGFQLGRFEQLDFEESFATRTIEQYLIAIGFPDRRELGRPRAMQAKDDPAGLAASQQHLLCHGKSSLLKLTLNA